MLGILLLVGCHKKHDDLITGSIPNSCSYTATTLYTGTVTPNVQFQDIAVAADETTKPDKLHIYLCRNIDCTVNPLPATQCSQYGLSNLTAPCYTTSPSVTIAGGPHTVRFINAGKEGYSDQAHINAGTPDIPAYSTYVITEQLCQ